MVRDNDVIGGGGICVSPGNRNTIIGNRVSDAEESISVEKGRGNLVARNVVIGARGNGIRLGIDRPAIGGAANVVRGNLVRRSRKDGFRVDGKDSRSLVRRNIAVASGDDGFDVESRTAKVTGNRAVRNGDLGIEAVWGVIDGGGNRATQTAPGPSARTSPVAELGPARVFMIPPRSWLFRHLRAEDPGTEGATYSFPPGRCAPLVPSAIVTAGISRSAAERPDHPRRAPPSARQVAGRRPLRI